MIGIRHRLADITEPVESAALSPTDEGFTFVDLASVDPYSKRIFAPKELVSADAPAKARQRLRRGDVLVSSIRPQLNRVASVPAVLDGAIATTVFSVLRARPEIVDERYLFHWVQRPQFIAETTRLASGASVTAVSDAQMRAMEMVLPSLPDQLQIASLLDAADQIRHDRRDAIALLDELAESFFLGLIESASGYGVIRDLVESAAYGTAAKESATRGATAAVPTIRVPIVRASDITADDVELDVARLTTVAFDAKELDRYLVVEGDVLFSRSASIARSASERSASAQSANISPSTSAGSGSKSAIFRGDQLSVFAAPLLRLRPILAVSADYLAHFLTSASATDALNALTSITPTNLLTASIPVPAVAGQALFAEQLRDLSMVKANELAQLARLDELYCALQSESFDGLTSLD